MCKSALLRLLKDPNEEYVTVQNVPSEELNDRSFIQYWEKHTHYIFGDCGYICPATHQLCKRDELDGAHVKIVDSKDDTIYITPVKQSFNRSKSDMPFSVKRKYLVIAPKQKEDKKE